MINEQVRLMIVGGSLDGSIDGGYSGIVIFVVLKLGGWGE